MHKRIPKNLQGNFPDRPHAVRDVRYKLTGEFRAPKKDEFYVSGSSIEAYRAPNDLTTDYWIAVPVEMVKCTCCNGTGRMEKPF